MILLKNKVNKSATMRDVRTYAEKTYVDSWESEYAIEKFIEGAEYLFKLLRIDILAYMVCKYKDKTWDNDAGCFVCDECNEKVKMEL